MEEVQKLTPCASEGKRYSTNICVHLQEYLQYGGTKKSKGFISGDAVLISTGESLGKKITYQDGKGNSVLLNVCPFCSGELHSIPFE